MKTFHTPHTLSHLMPVQSREEAWWSPRAEEKAEAQGTDSFPEGTGEPEVEVLGFASPFSLQIQSDVLPQTQQASHQQRMCDEFLPKARPFILSEVLCVQLSWTCCFVLCAFKQTFRSQCKHLKAFALCQAGSESFIYTPSFTLLPYPFHGCGDRLRELKSLPRV